VTGSVDDYELHRQAGFLVGAAEFVCLVDRHLRVLVAVEEEQGRIVGIDVKDWAGEAGEIGNVFRLAAEQEIERRYADAEAVGSGLVEDRGEIRAAVKANDSLDR
jgi:hypothetical protein